MKKQASMAFFKKIKINHFQLVYVPLFVKILAIFFIMNLISMGKINDTSIYSQLKLLNAFSYKWDSKFFIEVAVKWYPSGVGVKGIFSFAPLYPILIKLTNFLFSNYLFSAFLITNLFYFLSLAAFYLTMRLYLKEKQAFLATLIFAFFPPIFVYGLVSYSEPVYLFFAVMSWYFFAKEKFFYSGVLASLAFLARNIALLLPVIYFAILIYKHKSKLFRQVNVKTLWLLLPLLFLAGLSLYYSTRTGSLFTIFQAQASWGTKVENPLSQFLWLKDSWFSKQGDAIKILIDRYIFTIPMLILTILSFKISREIFIYCIIFMLFILSLVGTAAASSPRYLVCIWPAFVVIGKIKNTNILALVAFASLVLSFYTLNLQLTGFWT